MYLCICANVNSRVPTKSPKKQEGNRRHNLRKTAPTSSNAYLCICIFSKEIMAKIVVFSVTPKSASLVEYHTWEKLPSVVSHLTDSVFSYLLYLFSTTKVQDWRMGCPWSCPEYVGDV